jgi:hypothetical protein
MVKASTQLVLPVYARAGTQHAPQVCTRVQVGANLKAKSTGVHEYIEINKRKTSEG